jgi:hypothetical protein
MAPVATPSRQANEGGRALRTPKIHPLCSCARHWGLVEISLGDKEVPKYRINWGPGYRVYFGRDGEALVILLTGGTKQRQQRDIEKAKELWADYKRLRKPPGR